MDKPRRIAADMEPPRSPAWFRSRPWHRPGVPLRVFGRLPPPGNLVRFRQQGGYGFEGRGSTEEVALQFVALELTQELRLVLCLHTLGDHLNIERMPKRDDGRDDDLAFRILRHAVDEGAVDLQRGDREPGQVAERGVTSAEIVHYDVHARITQGLEPWNALADVPHDEALRDLQVQPATAYVVGGLVLGDDSFHRFD